MAGQKTQEVSHSPGAVRESQQSGNPSRPIADAPQDANRSSKMGITTAKLTTENQIYRDPESFPG